MRRIPGAEPVSTRGGIGEEFATVVEFDAEAFEKLFSSDLPGPEVFHVRGHDLDVHPAEAARL